MMLYVSWFLPVLFCMLRCVNGERFIEERGSSL